MLTPSPLRLRRVALGLRLGDVEIATGIRDAVLSGVERGRRDLRGRVLCLLADYYGVTATTLVAEHAGWLSSSCGQI